MQLLVTYFSSPLNIIVTAIFLIFALLCIAALQGCRFPDRASVWTWMLLAGISSSEASLLFATRETVIRVPEKIFGIVAGAAFLAALLGRDRKSGTPDLGCRKKRSSVPLIIMSISAAGLFIYLLIHLTTYSEIILNWEGQVLRGFGAELDAGASLQKIILSRLLWENGLVSSGERSFLYGVFTHIVLLFTTFSTWSIRIVPLVSAFLCVPIIWQIGRRYFGVTVAFTACLLYLSNPAILYYSRYGTSLSSTVFCLLLALWSAIALFSSRRPPWWSGLTTGTAFFLTTLHYSPARLCVIFFTGFIFAHTAFLRWEWTKEKIAALMMLVLTIGLVSALEYRFEGSDSFLNARGEQLFKLVQAPDWVKDQIGIRKSYLELDPDERTLLVKKLIKTTASQFLSVVSPLFGMKLKWSGISTVGDPPALPLYFGPLLPFFLWGFLLKTFAGRQARWLIFTLWILSVGPVLLLTNRVDIHRAFVLVIPFIFFAAAGIQDFIESASPLLGHASVRITAGAAASALIMALPLVMLREDRASKVDSLTRNVASFAAGDERPVKIALGSDHKNCSWLEMLMVEKNRRTGSAFNESYDALVVEKIEDEKFQEAAAKSRLDTISSGPENDLLILVPRIPFEKLRKLAEARGCKVTGRKFAGEAGYLIEDCTRN